MQDVDLKRYRAALHSLGNAFQQVGKAFNEAADALMEARIGRKINAQDRLRSWMLGNKAKGSSTGLTYTRQGIRYIMTVTTDLPECVAGTVDRILGSGGRVASNSFKINADGSIVHAPSHLKQMKWRE